MQLSRRRRRTAGINPAARSARGAFTLVEMLVAVGLVVLMMTLFASIFQMATGALSQQKGLSENDQRARLVETLLRNDLNGNKTDSNNQPRAYRTFRILLPYAQAEPELPIDPVSGTVASPDDRAGYFAISENNPFDDTDDVLSLTVRFADNASERFYGKAAVVLPDVNLKYGPPDQNGNTVNPGNFYPPTTVPALPATGIGQYWTNQPEFDDYLGAINQAGNSTRAEVVYFLRRGTLYRRVMLIRKPNVANVTDGAPADDSGKALSLAWYNGTGNVTRNFWGDFDYSAYYDYITGALQFHSIPDLVANDATVAANTTTSQSKPAGALANPGYRFGHDTVLSVTNPTFGQPREHDSQGNFIGRFTQGETSATNFGYPGTVNPNPMTAGTKITYASTTGLIQQYNGGYRIAEDALMTNVLKFDIKVWDPKASSGPDGQFGIAGVDDDGNGTVDDVTELGAPGSDDGAFVDIGHGGTYGCYNASSSNNLYYSPGLVQQGNAFWNQTWGNGSPVFINRYDTWNPYLNLDGDGMLDVPPYGPTRYFDATGMLHNPVVNNPGLYPVGIGPDHRPGVAGIDDDGANGIDDIRELGWPGTDDFMPLSAIQIKVTFYETTSKQLREVTFVQSLLYSQ